MSVATEDGGTWQKLSLLWHAMTPPNNRRMRRSITSNAHARTHRPSCPRTHSPLRLKCPGDIKAGFRSSAWLGHLLLWLISLWDWDEGSASIFLLFPLLPECQDFSHICWLCVSILSCFSAFNFSFIQPFPDFTHLLFLTWKHPPTWCCCNYFPLQVVTAPQDMIVLCQHANAALICFFLMLPLLPLKWNLGSRVTSVLPQTKLTVEDQMFCVMKINL